MAGYFLYNLFVHGACRGTTSTRKIRLMINLKRDFAVFAVLLAAGTAPSSAWAVESLKPKALVIMLDGMRADAVENACARNIRCLRDGRWQKGYRCAWTLTANTILDADTISGPNHIAIACGITFAKHRTPGNGKNMCDHSKWPSFLARLVAAKPDKKALFMYSWNWDGSVAPCRTVEFVYGTDEENAKNLPLRLAASDAPDAILWYIDYPDHAGHGCGYYPYSTGYLNGVYQADMAIGAALDAIASRSSFNSEDWLVIVTADHGGYSNSHGMMNGQATTIPLLVSSRSAPQGCIPGTPHNYDVAPTVLKHFGVDFSGMGLDGNAIGGKIEEETPRRLVDGLAVYLPFDGGKAGNRVASGPKPGFAKRKTALLQKGRFIGGCLHIEDDGNGECGAVLKGSENLKFENGGDFAFAMWVRMAKKQSGDPLILGNKDWTSGRNPGVALVASKLFPSKHVKKVSPGVAFNTGIAGGGRNELGPFNIEYGEWIFYAATCDRNGVLRFYQGARDGNLYMMSENIAGAVIASGMPFRLGQDGTGKYKNAFCGDIDDFAFWTRTLSHGDVRRIYEAGRKGVPLSSLIEEESLSQESN